MDDPTLELSCGRDARRIQLQIANQDWRGETRTRAAVYIETGRNIETARALLEKYLASPLTPDDPSREEAQKLLHQASGG